MKTKNEITRELFERRDEYLRKKEKRMNLFSGMMISLIGFSVMLSVIVVPPLLKRNNTVSNPHTSTEQTTTDPEFDVSIGMKELPTVDREEHITCYYLEIVDPYDSPGMYLGKGGSNGNRDVGEDVLILFTFPKTFDYSDSKIGDSFAIYCLGELEKHDPTTKIYSPGEVVYAVEIQYISVDYESGETAEHPVKKDGGELPIIFTGIYDAETDLITAKTPVGELITVGEELSYYSPLYDIGGGLEDGEELLLLCDGIVAASYPAQIEIYFAAKKETLKTDDFDGFPDNGEPFLTVSSETANNIYVFNAQILEILDDGKQYLVKVIEKNNEMLPYGAEAYINVPYRVSSLKQKAGDLIGVYFLGETSGNNPDIPIYKCQFNAVCISPIKSWDAENEKAEYNGCFSYAPDFICATITVTIIDYSI